MAGRRLAMLEWTGLFDSRFNQQGLDTALYMSRPYEPGKIPVIFVHGLVSSPRAWVKTINELENTPLIESRYQFWVFLYPTGLPIPSSAQRLRESLVRVRNVVDPSHSDPALDRTVLVGHSMGGVLSKMMAQHTGSTLWNAAITVPRDRFRAPPELREALNEMLVFEPVPFVSRVVFIATPHRGSPIANGPVGMGCQQPDAPADGAGRADRRDRGLERPECAHAELRALAAQRDQQPADRQPDPGRPGPDPDRPVGPLSLDHSPAQVKGRGFRRRGRLCQLAPGGCRIGEDRRRRSFLAGNARSHSRDQANPARTPGRRAALAARTGWRLPRSTARDVPNAPTPSTLARLRQPVNYLTVPTCLGGRPVVTMRLSVR